MAFAATAIWMQPMVNAVAPGGGGDCDPYTMPAATSIITNLDTAPVFQPVTTVETNLCSTVS